MSVDSKVVPIERVAEILGLLHRNSVKAGLHEDYWKQHAALSAESIGKAIFAEDVVLFIRREIRRREGLLIDAEELVGAIHSLFTPEVQQQIGPPKIRLKRAAKHNNKVQPGDVAPATVVPSDTEPPSAQPGIAPQAQ
jgi:hypothetical protein